MSQSNSVTGFVQDWWAFGAWVTSLGLAWWLGEKRKEWTAADTHKRTVELAERLLQIESQLAARMAAIEGRLHAGDITNTRFEADIKHMTDLIRDIHETVRRAGKE